MTGRSDMKARVQRPERTPVQHRADILRRHARTGPRGHPSRCLKEGQKVIFDTWDAAKCAEFDLAAAFGSSRQGAYRCPHGDHFHLTRRRKP